MTSPMNRPDLAVMKLTDARIDDVAAYLAGLK